MGLNQQEFDMFVVLVFFRDEFGGNGEKSTRNTQIHEQDLSLNKSDLFKRFDGVD